MSDQTPRVVVITRASQGISAALVPAYMEEVLHVLPG
jgi:hypothetical protein